jgi:hypothetical protein
MRSAGELRPSTLRRERGTGRYVSVDEPSGASRTMAGVTPLTMLLLLRVAVPRFCDTIEYELRLWA